ncbi:hypothetical protein DL769_001958 [Monosporascus sp. CRB-8-3]|nr:hypothetical protein DL769_001958 [Monosporascus sp. CRB-8-3]
MDKSLSPQKKGSDANKDVPFIIGHLLSDSGLILPSDSDLSQEEQSMIQTAIERHMTKFKDWATKTSNDRLVCGLSYLFKAFILHRARWLGWHAPGVHGFWTKARKSAQWPKLAVKISTIIKLARILIQARKDYVSTTSDTARKPENQLSTEIQRFIDEVEGQPVIDAADCQHYKADAGAWERIKTEESDVEIKVEDPDD